MIIEILIILIIHLYLEVLSIVNINRIYNYLVYDRKKSTLPLII